MVDKVQIETEDNKPTLTITNTLFPGTYYLCSKNDTGVISNVTIVPTIPETIYVGENNPIKVNVINSKGDKISGAISYTYNNETKTTRIGTELNFKPVKAGEHILKITYNGDEDYNSTQLTIKLEAVLQPVKLKIGNAGDGIVPLDIVISAYNRFNGAVTEGYVNAKVGNDSPLRLVLDNTGKAVLRIRKYYDENPVTVTADYIKTSTYDSATVTKNITLVKKSTRITLNDGGAKSLPFTAIATIKDIDGKSVNEGYCTAKLNNKLVTTEEGVNKFYVKNGIVVIPFDSDELITTADIKITYVESANYESSSYTYTKTFPPKDTMITITNKGTGILPYNVTAKITTTDNKPVPVGNCIIKINGLTRHNEETALPMKYQVSSDGTISIPVFVKDVKNDHTTMVIKYIDNEYFNTSENSITLPLTLQDTAITISYPNNPSIPFELKAKVHTLNNEPVTNGLCVAKMDGVSIRDENGRSILYNLDENGEITVPITTPTTHKKIVIEVIYQGVKYIYNSCRSEPVSINLVQQ